MGRCAIDHYKEVKRYSVFSHDELICKLASECQYLDPAIGDATKFELDYIVKQEKTSRKSAYERVCEKKNFFKFILHIKIFFRERLMVIVFVSN
jgi:histone demethylase JARID1